VPGGIKGNYDVKKWAEICGKPIKQGKIDAFDYDVFQIKTEFGIREMEVIYNPDMEKYMRYRLITIR
jgi:hypothetical protein